VDTAGVVGLVPAAGRADRLGKLPCSKEILPLGFQAGTDGTLRPKPVCQYLLESFQQAGIERVFLLLRQGKWDVPALLGSGDDLGLHLAYLALEPTASVPATLDRAFPFVAEARIALGFPDILFTPTGAYGELLRHQETSGADVVLGLFPTRQSWKSDMVELDPAGRVRRLVIKEPDAGLAYTWSIAVWGPVFSRFLHDFVAGEAAAAPAARTRELYVGDVLQAAIDAGLRVEAVTFPGGSYRDVGTPEDLQLATLELAGGAPLAS
jgi:glucose-1-phosphate thymidylyltransferase